MSQQSYSHPKAPQAWVKEAYRLEHQASSHQWIWVHLLLHSSQEEVSLQVLHHSPQLPHFPTKEDSNLKIIVITNNLNTRVNQLHLEATEPKAISATNNTRVAITREVTIIPNTTTTAIRVVVNRATMVLTKVTKDTIRMRNLTNINLNLQLHCITTRALITTSRLTTPNLSNKSLRVVISNQRLAHKAITTMLQLHSQGTILKLKLTLQSLLHHR